MKKADAAIASKNLVLCTVITPLVPKKIEWLIRKSPQIKDLQKNITITLDKPLCQYLVIFMLKKPLKSLPTPMVGVSGIAFNKHREVLLIRRNQEPAKGLWSIPGGKLESGETLTEACLREIEEETGLKTRILSLVALVERRIENFHYVIADFLVEIIGDENRIPIADSDVSEAHWISLDRLDEYALVPGLRDIIENTHRLFLTGALPGLIDRNGKTGDFICS